jgi:drug/metabolite transporter (DMT)-like permease
VGLYIATLFLVWQVVAYITFRTTPSLPIMAGGTLIVLGGLLVTFWSVARPADVLQP